LFFFCHLSYGSALPSSAVFQVKRSSLVLLYRILLFLLLVPALLILGEFAFFLQMTLSEPALQPSDLIAVFTGEAGRIEEGFRLANQGYSPHLLVSRSSFRALERYQRKLETSNAFDCRAEDKSRTTFEDALHTKRTMSENGMHSVILVTSWDHMPRAYLLLFMLSHGSDVRIRWTRVPTGKLDAANWYTSSEGWKRTYNEMLELWGSLYELAAYRVKGRLPEKAPNQSAIVISLRNVLLFDIRRIHAERDT
jgi:uncharacterized SAM-binding protein YcdF (DUF218 family)